MAKEERMKKYLGKVKQCIKGFTTTQFQQIPREENVEADVLAKTTSVDNMVGDQIKVQYTSCLSCSLKVPWFAIANHCYWKGTD